MDSTFWQQSKVCPNGCLNRIFFLSFSVNTQILNSHVDNKIPFQTLKCCQTADYYVGYQNIIRLRNYNAKQNWKEIRDTVNA